MEIIKLKLIHYVLVTLEYDRGQLFVTELMLAMITKRSLKFIVTVVPISGSYYFPLMHMKVRISQFHPERF